MVPKLFSISRFYSAKKNNSSNHYFGDQIFNSDKFQAFSEDIFIVCNIKKTATKLTFILSHFVRKRYSLCQILMLWSYASDIPQGSLFKCPSNTENNRSVRFLQNSQPGICVIGKHKTKCSQYVHQLIFNQWMVYYSL